MYLVTAAQKLGAGLSTTGLAGCGYCIYKNKLYH